MAACERMADRFCLRGMSESEWRRYTRSHQSVDEEDEDTESRIERDNGAIDHGDDADVVVEGENAKLDTETGGFAVDGSGFGGQLAKPENVSERDDPENTWDDVEFGDRW